MDKEKRIKLNLSLYNGESVYVYYWEDEIVVRFQRINKELMCYPKGKGRKPKEFNFKDNTYAQDALALGEPITKEEYERF